MSSDSLIEVRGLGKRYDMFAKPVDRLVQLMTEPLRRGLGMSPVQHSKEVWALRNVTFDVPRGEALGVMGRNGSGKSTMLQMLCGTITPTEGEVQVRGRIAALLELGAGFNPEFTGRENVFLNGRLLGLDSATIEARFDDICAFADIGAYIDEPTKTYSSGMFVRLAFAVATSVDADILVVDEALAVGDARFQARCMKRIRAIQDEGASVLFVSHDVAAVRTLCQRALWLERGAMKELGPVLQVSSRYMESIFADDPDALHPSGGVGEPSSENEIEVPALETPVVEAATREKPLAHWGQQVGLIREVRIGSVEGTDCELLEWGQTCRIGIRLTLPLDYSPDTFRVAFSIKDLRGHDIVVSSTADTASPAPTTWSAGAEVEIEFVFENGLVEGKYFLVAAAERRIGPVVEYYEYIEGVRYFSVMSSVRHFGIYQPKIEHLFKELSRV
ncbi:ABC transporter ATP-binding protein [Stenotrophomonas maltophilia]|uniref:ABC transporter ATP-binding protein n=1 Tax=Stenotrophomonas maltophilia TaxID=40324 RepID=UPI00066BBF48|nr:ABC transporter ATP-binding protein [Stenotrophomonas maltophilia]